MFCPEQPPVLDALPLLSVGMCLGALTWELLFRKYAEYRNREFLGGLVLKGSICFGEAVLREVQAQAAAARTAEATRKLVVAAKEAKEAKAK